MLNSKEMKIIDDFWSAHNAPVTEKGYCWSWFDRYSEDAGAVEDIFWNKLIKANDFDSEAKHQLIDRGYKVLAGSRDSFGIVVALVIKDNKAFAFG